MIAEYDAAEEPLRKVLEVNANDLLAHFYAALVYLGKREEVKASEEWKYGLSLVQRPKDLVYPIEEADELSKNEPPIPGAKEMLEDLLATKERLLNSERKKKSLYI
jgi:hypothetical protein